MPNSPSRIDNTDGEVEHERINFVDPGNFGAERKPHMHIHARLKLHVAFVLIAIILIVLIVALQLGLI